MTPEELLRRIEAYLATSDESASAFGKRVLGDPSFVYDLRAGREPRYSTMKKAAEALPVGKARAA